MYRYCIFFELGSSLAACVRNCFGTSMSMLLAAINFLQWFDVNRLVDRPRSALCLRPPPICSPSHCSGHPASWVPISAAAQRNASAFHLALVGRTLASYRAAATSFARFPDKHDNHALLMPLQVRTYSEAVVLVVC